MDRWFFIHVMKTAGTSFRTMLEDSFDADIYPTKAELARHPNNWYLKVPELLDTVGRGAIDLSRRRVLCGHYPASLVDKLDGPWRTVTFLRDPVKRTLSLMAHKHRRDNRLHRFMKLDVSRYLDMPEFIEGQVRNYQTKVFALENAEDVGRRLQIDDAAFARAKARLLGIDIVGLTEQFPLSIRLFEEASNIRFGSLPHRNKSHSYSPTPSDIKRIRELVPYDLELYEIARQKLLDRAAVAA